MRVVVLVEGDLYALVMMVVELVFGSDVDVVGGGNCNCCGDWLC